MDITQQVKDVQLSISNALAQTYNGGKSLKEAPNNVRSIIFKELAHVTTILSKLYENNKDFKFELSDVSRIITNAINMGLSLDQNPDTVEIYIMPRAKQLVAVLTKRAYMKLFNRANSDFAGFLFQPIYQNDKYEFDSERIWKIINYVPAKEGQKGDIEFFYIEFLDKKGFAIFGDRMDAKDVRKRRNVSKTGMAWDAWYESMAMKTVVKHTLKHKVVLNTTSEIAEFIKMIEHEEIQAQTIDTEPIEVK